MSNDFTPPPPPPPTVPGYGPLFPPPPPPPKRPSTALVAALAAVGAAILSSAVTALVTTSGDDGPEAAPTVTVTETAAAADAADGEGAADTGEEPSADATDDGAYALTDTVAYDSDGEIGLSRFSRGVSNDYASPENTPYAKFTIKVVNNSGKTFDATSLTVSCAYGDEGKESESIFDDGLDGTPDTSVLAGRSLSFTWGCELPEKEKYLQIEVAPDVESETAIFAGQVK
ncbi:hypothetical protein ABZ733_25535 [Streptomyces longwoodensis]|uniref:hypothetical protein n=1 Tax=Streptomyces longwoodensis TaxID=68231 RepID=UPI0033EDF4EC